MSSLADNAVLEPGPDPARVPLVLLHGSHGSESDLLPMARRIRPGATLLGLRGTVALEEGFAFFRRHADRRVDEDDLRSRVPALAALVRRSVEEGRFAEAPVVVGYSNGAIMGAALVATFPEVVAGAVLLRPLSPFGADAAYRRSGLPVLVLDGAHDERRAAGDGQRLAARLTRSGAAVTHEVLPVGHAITSDDERRSGAWLQALQALR